MKVTVFDKQSYKISSRVITDEGFLRVPARVARTGIQEYLALELGIKDGDPMRVIKVMRPPEEVFAQESLDSYRGADVTIEHPKSFVDAETYNKISKGTTLSAVPDGDFVKSDLVIKAKDAIDAVENGKVEVSAGYTAIYDEAPEGADYDYVQRNIRVNHVALVSTARAGRQARLFDNKPSNQPEKTMGKIVLDSGRSVELEDSATAALISDSIEGLQTKVADSEKALEQANATLDSLKEKTEKLEADLKKATDAETVKARLKSLADTQDSAKRIAGKEFVCDSVDEMEIKRAAMAATRDSINWADKSDDYVSAAFDFADEEMKKEEEEEDEYKDKAKKSKEKMAKDAAGAHVKKAVDSRGKRQFMDSNAWRVRAGQMTHEQLQKQADDQFGG